MPEYKGNGIYDYLKKDSDAYFFCTEDRWILVYGNSHGIPKLLAFVSRAYDIASPFDISEQNDANRACRIAAFLKLPYIFIRFMENSGEVRIWDSNDRIHKNISYSQLRDLFEKFGVVQPGTPKKDVNQYVSSPYHNWQRENLGQITVSDLDLIKYRNGRMEEIIELKRSKKSIECWTPYTSDYANFALLINAIVGSGERIRFTLYYNVLYDGAIGSRKDDISKIKVFDFIIPNAAIDHLQVKYKYRGIFTLKELTE